MKTRPIPAHRPFLGAALLALLAAMCVGCGHVLIVQPSGRLWRPESDPNHHFIR